MSERELFNRWWVDNNLPYENDDKDINLAWEAWQASANRQGYKLVPVDDLHSIHNELAEEHPNYHLLFSILQKYLGTVE